MARGSVTPGRASPTRPARSARRGTWPAWREFFAEQRAPQTSLNRPIGADRRLAIVGSRLELIKQIAHTHQAKVNDVVLAAVAGGLRQLLASRGEPVEGLMRTRWCPSPCTGSSRGRRAGNQDGSIMVPLPLGSPTRSAGCARSP